VARGWTLIGWLLPATLLTVKAVETPRAEVPRGTRQVLRRDAFRSSVAPTSWAQHGVLSGIQGAGLEMANGGEPSLADFVEPCAMAAEAVPSREAREVFSGGTGRRQVALTFDDGPSRENTPRILDVLAKHDVRVTFFVLGDRGERMPDLLEALDAGGHDVGNHSWSHPSFRSLWRSQIQDEVCRTNAVIERAIGKTPVLMRPPYGRFAPSALSLLGGLGFDVVLWSVDSLDWDAQTPEVIAQTVVSRARPGSIVLLHDRRSVTVHALPKIIEGLRARGFEIVPVSEMLGQSAYREIERAASTVTTLASGLPPALPESEP